MNKQPIYIAVGVAALLLLVGAGVMLYGLSQGGALPGMAQPTPTPAASRFGDIPKIEITPPASLAELSEELRAEYPELADLLDNPELSSVYKDFYLAYQNGGEPTALALAEQRGILNQNDELVMTLVLDTEESADLVTQLEAEGVIVTGVFRNLVSIAIPISLIKEKAETEAPSEIIERISNLEHVIKLELPQKATPKQGEEIRGQGVGVTLADKWQQSGITGQGIKVGVLDLGFGGYQDLLGVELPANVTVAKFGDEYAFDEEVHGTACAEIVHEMAPDAELVLAYYDGTDLAFGQAVEWLMEQEVDIITNSTGSNGLTPMDGTGFSAELVDEAQQAGIFWVNAAGNEATSHWRGQFNDANGDDIHDFFPDSDVIPFIPFGPGYETSIILSWDDWQAVDQDYELLLLDGDGNLLAKSEDYQDGQPGAIPAEGFFYEFEDDNIYLLAIENAFGEARGDATFDLFIHNGEFHPDYLVPDFSLSNPADARGAFAVGAVHWSDDVLEPYSSRGPTADGRIKPDIAAPSVVDSASYVDEGFNGTSAAAPHVAGAAALLMQARPEFKGNPQALAEFLQGLALDLGDSGPDNAFGAGRLTLGQSPAPAAEAPQQAEAPAAEEAEEARQIRPTSTPRPAPEVGLPGQDTGLPGSSTSAAEDDSAAALVGFFVLGGLCLMCLAGLVIMAVALGAIIAAVRRR
ncbi:MAG: hypothetical protein Kow0031_21530 [Anaerolineae bacterium]